MLWRLGPTRMLEPSVGSRNLYRLAWALRISRELPTSKVLPAPLEPRAPSVCSQYDLWLQGNCPFSLRLPLIPASLPQFMPARDRPLQSAACTDRDVAWTWRTPFLLHRHQLVMAQTCPLVFFNHVSGNHLTPWPHLKSHKSQSEHIKR